jgi:MFS family permease
MGLWRQPEFLKFWAGQAVSLLGTQVTELAIGLTAAVVLQASPLQMGVLGTLYSVPYVLFGLLAGVWVDRVRRRPLLIAADIGRAVLLVTVPVAAVMNQLSMGQLYVVAFGVGTLNVIFAVAYGSFLPSIVSRADLQEGNTKLALAEAISRVGGPGIAGILVQILTAPLAIIADAASFLVSAVSLTAVHAQESPPQADSHKGVWGEMKEGVAAVAKHPLLRPLLIGSNLGNLSDGVHFSSGVVLLFLTRELHFEPAVLGVVISGLGIGGLIGAVLNGPVTRKLGPGLTIVGSLGMWAFGGGGLAFVPDSPLAPLLVGGLLGVLGAINPIAGATVATLRQAVTPDRLLGRVTAVVRVAVWGSIAVGALVGGVLAERIGLRATLFLGGLLPLLGLLWLAASPIRGLRSLDSYAACSSDS